MWFKVCSTLFIAWVKAKSSRQRDKSQVAFAYSMWSLFRTGEVKWELTQNKEKDRNCTLPSFIFTMTQSLHCLRDRSPADVKQHSSLSPKHYQVDCKWWKIKGKWTQTDMQIQAEPWWALAKTKALGNESSLIFVFPYFTFSPPSVNYSQISLWSILISLLSAEISAIVKSLVTPLFLLFLLVFFKVCLHASAFLLDVSTLWSLQ